MIFLHIIYALVFLCISPYAYCISFPDRDFICVQAMDGVLTFYEQETFSFQSFLPNFLLPGPIQYVAEKDSFLIGTSARNLECYKLVE